MENNIANFMDKTVMEELSEINFAVVPYDSVNHHARNFFSVLIRPIIKFISIINSILNKYSISVELILLSKFCNNNIITFREKQCICINHIKYDCDLYEEITQQI